MDSLQGYPNYLSQWGLASLEGWKSKCSSRAGRRCVHILDWDALVCGPKERGGAGLGKVELMNKALLAKQGWRVITRGEEPWCKVLHARKYGVNEEGPLVFKAKKRSNLLQAGLRWEVDNGRRAMFWKDKWLNDTPLLQKCLQPMREEEAAVIVNSY